MKKPVVITLISLSVVAVAAAGIGAFSLRGVIDEVLTHEKEVTASDIPAFEKFREADGPMLPTKQPAWMADDATDIRLRFDTTDKPGWDIRFDSATGLTPELLVTSHCKPVTEAAPPALKVDWIPASIDAQNYYYADDFRYIAQKGDTVYGWKSAESKPTPRS
jgi:hypothetical protein